MKMTELLLTAFSCFALGLMTSIHPCPLAINAGAISLLTSWTKDKSIRNKVLFFFISGYIFAFLILGIILSASGIHIPHINNFLNNYIGQFIGPVLIIAGMFHVDLLKINKHKNKILSWLESKQWTGIQALPMGFILALSFCPATASLFFLILFPIAVEHQQMLLFPAIYAAGAGIPLVITAMLISKGTSLLKNNEIQKKLSYIAGCILIIIGIYLTITKIY